MLEILIWLSILLAWCGRVAYLDLRTFRIANTDLFFGFLIYWPVMFIHERISFGYIGLSLLFISAVVVGFSGLIGMGDIKLFLIFAPWLHLDNWVVATVLLIVIPWLQIGLAVIRVRSIPAKIAFAPAILLAVAVNMAS